MGETGLIVCKDCVHLALIKSKTMISNIGLRSKRETIKKMLITVHSLNKIKSMKINSFKNVVSLQSKCKLVQKLPFESFYKMKMK